MRAWLGLAALSALAIGCDPGSRGMDGGSDAMACAVATCESNVARTCDREVTVDCGRFDARCLDFIDPDGARFAWCGCGRLPEGRGLCLGTRDAVLCEGPIALPILCPEGTRCGLTDGEAGIGCFCDNELDGVCPDEVCSFDPDCCVPSCEGRECGSDGCVGSCGTCPSGHSCSEGTCVEGCTPTCGSRVCGPDGCGGTCGECPPRYECAPDRARCACSPLSWVDYRFTSEEVDWTVVDSIVIHARQLGEDGVPSAIRSAHLDSTQRSAMLSFAACEPHLEILRSYFVASAMACEAVDIVTRAEIALPPPTGSDGVCAPLTCERCEGG